MIQGYIDLRSDTVTVPTEAMRKAIFEAPVGDDVYGDDPTINRLQEMAAALFHKEAALFVPTGTMGNQLALFTHVDKGDEVILPDNCHVVVHEAGAAAHIAGAQLRCIQTIGGEMPLDLVEKAIRKNTQDVHSPTTKLITYENADSDGRVRTLDYMKKIREISRKYQIPVHIDGARIFNAARVLGVEVGELAPYYDSISVCLSKGLCAPVGSLLIGSKPFIAKALRRRKIMGGGMRQAGILAAAGIVALEEMTNRLQEDHLNARYLAERLKEIPGIAVKEDQADINMVFFCLDGYPLSSQDLVALLEKHKIRINGEDEGIMRFVTHYYVSREEIDQVIHIMKNPDMA